MSDAPKKSESGEHRLHFGPAEVGEPSSPEQAVQEARNAQLKADLRAGVIGRALQLCIDAIRRTLDEGMTPNVRIALTEALMKGEGTLGRYLDSDGNPKGP